MGLDWIVVCGGLFKNNEHNYKFLERIDEMREELQNKHKMTLSYRGQKVVNLLLDIEIENEDASKLCFGKEVIDINGVEKGTYLTDNQIENIIDCLEFIKTSNYCMRNILEKENCYYDNKKQIIETCNNALSFLKKVKDYDGEHFIKVACWY